ncbi:MAG: hypothetical protein K0Q85_708 [Caproiciproducens sp.]|nr:hypothetical protein [Caproiciproducens sp.]
MKIQSKTLLRVSAAAMALGLILLSVGYFSGAKYSVAAGRNGIHVIDSTPHSVKNLTLEPFQSIDVEVGQTDIELIHSDHYGVDIQYYGDTELPQYTVENGTLKISDTPAQKAGFLWLNMNFNFMQTQNIIKIYLPANTSLKNIKVQNNTGSFQLNGITAEKADIHLDFGSLQIRNAVLGDTSIVLQNGSSTIQNTDVKNLSFANDFGKSSFENFKTDSVTNSTIKAKNGQIDITNFSSTGPLLLEDKFGGIRVDGMKAESVKSTMQNGKLEMYHSQINDLTAENSFGEINLNDLTSNGLNLKSGNGSISLNGTPKGSSTIKSDFGKVTVKTSLTQSKYNYDFSTNFGSVKINGQSAGNNVRQNNSTENALSIHCQNGGFDADFQQ